MATRTYCQDRWEAMMHYAMQAAIGDALRAEYEQPTGLTPELSAILSKLDKSKAEQK
jgi:hypothetical protein